jgi:5'-3' exonuclease
MSIRPCLIDGTFELFRAFYGAPSQHSSSGQEVGASVALGRSLLSLQRQSTFTHFAVAFDTVIESFRNRLFPGYKTGDGIDPALLGQFTLAERVTQALGFRVLSMVEFEADDGLASATQLFLSLQEVDKVTIASPDKDLMQMVGPRVVTWDRMRNKEYDCAAVVAKMGVEPASIPDYLALVGDTADGIPGIARWGAKSAATVLAHYRHLEEIPSDHRLWAAPVRGAQALAEQLAQHRELGLLYRELATLRRDVPLELSPADFLYQGPDSHQVQSLELELGVRLTR